jgi:hypothetical protein
MPEQSEQPGVAAGAGVERFEQYRALDLFDHFLPGMPRRDGGDVGASHRAGTGGRIGYQQLELLVEVGTE